MLDYLNQLKISTRLIILVGLLLIGGAIAFIFLNRIKVRGPEYEQILENERLIADLLPPPAYIVESYFLAFQEAYETNTQTLEEMIQKSQALYDIFEERYQAWRAELPENQIKRILFQEAYQFGKEFFDIWHMQFLPAIRNKNKEEAIYLLQGTLKRVYQEHSDAVNKVVKLAKEANIELEHEAEALYATTRTQFRLVWIPTVLMSCLIAYLIGRSITHRLNYALEGISAVSAGINSRMDQQAKFIAQQSSSVHETTSAMDELHTSFQHTESLAQESSVRAKNALKVSEDGNSLLKEMLDGLRGHKEKVSAILDQILRLNEIVHQIRNLASAINNLTNQTNILALNAAVQAAHVKQSGEGFSVIASEIRKLADESKKFVSHIDLLAENIKIAMDSTVHIAEEGAKTVQDSIKLSQSSAKAFDSIISITTNSFEGTEQVSLNVQQQGQAVHQVLEAMESLNELSQQNLVGMNEVKAELEKLNQLSQKLKTII